MNAATGDRDFDVIVIGAGGAGLACAASAAADGARVLVAEAGQKVGGSTALSGGNILAGGTHVQASAGVSDSAERLYETLALLNQHLTRPGVVRRYCQEAPGTLLWLESLGAEFPASELRVTGAFGPARAHRAFGHGAELVAVLERAARSRGVEIATNTRVRDLARDARGQVTGVDVDGFVVTAPAVVLAAGGFGANAPMIRKLYPSAVAQPDWSWYIGSPHAQGDAFTLAAPFDPQHWGIDEGLLLLTANYSRDVEIYLPGWLMFVNQNGERFIDETTDYAIQSFAVQRQRGGLCHAVFDEACLRKASSSRADPRTAFPSPNWKEDRLRQLVAEGAILQARTARDLAGALGIDPERFAASTERYNRMAAAAFDADYGKPREWLEPLLSPPFYAATLRPSVISFTGAGLRIDEHARVLSGGKPIPGLFAAGEATGGLGGPVYAGNGASVGNAVVFGRIAGVSAASFALLPEEA